jgi:hypothetical protein
MRGTASDSPRSDAARRRRRAHRDADGGARRSSYDHVQIDASQVRRCACRRSSRPACGDFGETTTEQLKFLARVLHDKKAKAFLIMHARSLELAIRARPSRWQRQL